MKSRRYYHRWENPNTMDEQMKAEWAARREAAFDLQFKEAEARGPEYLRAWFEKEEKGAKELNAKYEQMIADLRKLKALDEQRSG